MGVNLRGRIHRLDREQVQGAWATTAGHGVHDHEPVITRHQLDDQAHAGRPNLHHLDTLGYPRLRETAHHLDAEAVIAAKHVAEAGHQRAGHRSPRRHRLDADGHLDAAGSDADRVHGQPPVAAIDAPP